MDKISRVVSFFIISILILMLFYQSIIGNFNTSNNAILIVKKPIIIIGPYYQNTGKNLTLIIWQTNSQTSVNSVCYGSSIACENKVYKNFTTDFHQIKITNLTPSSKYYYKVISDTIESDIFTFHTISGENETIRFIVYGDSRGVWDSWNNASRVAESIEKEHPNFVLHTGDLVRDGKISEQWIDFFSISTFIHNSTLYPSIGNHEYYSNLYSKYFITSKHRYWYSFNYGPAHFISLDSNIINSINIFQLIWLIKDLKFNNQPVIIVFFHHPMYSSGNHGSSFYLRILWEFIFRFYNVDMVFNGHDHCYERGQVNDIFFIVTGGGGAPLYDIGKKWWTIYSEKTHHYCLLTINNDNILFEAKNPEGDIIDSISIEI